MGAVAFFKRWSRVGRGCALRLGFRERQITAAQRANLSFIKSGGHDVPAKISAERNLPQYRWYSADVVAVAVHPRHKRRKDLFDGGRLFRDQARFVVVI